MRNSITYVSDNLYFLSHIKEILDERYKAGFPVIKEIIQNANDGCATRLDFGVIRSLGDKVAHSLLKSPALFFLNNGSFSHDDEKAIIRIGVDANAGDKSKIGKFGLGQKSIFHFCEAFFYMARSEYIPDGCGSLIDPWAEGDADLDRPEWTQLSEDDFQAVEAYLIAHGLIQQQNSRYFLLWVPLRQPAPDDRYIIENYQDADTIQSQFPDDMAVQIGRSLPSLRHLLEVHYWVQKADQTLERKFKVHLKGIDDQQLERCRYPQSEQESSVSESSAEYELKGAVLISSSQNQLQFAGKERLVSPDVFSSLLDGSHSSAQDTLDILQRSAYWTKRMSINKRAEKNLVPDKAIPHCAVIFSRKKLTDSPQAKLTIQWAVFLPMSGQDQDQSEQEEFQEYKCTGDYDYTLLLHGYFFLDSGRRYIHSLKSIIADSVPPEVPTSIDKMNRQWNRLLATHGTLRLILPALHQFVATHKLSDAEVFNLCKLLNQSTTCNGHSRQHVCAEYQWIYRLHPHKDEWVLLNTNIRVLSLPTKAPNWSVFSALHQIAEQSCLTYSKFSNLRIERPNDTWTEIEVSNIIASLEASMIFTNRQHIDYLLEFLKISQAVDCVIVQDKIEKLIKQCFQVINVQQLQQPEILTSLKKLIQLIEPQRRFKLQKVQTSDETIKNILPELYKLNLKCLLVYAPFEPPSNPSGARLDDRSANFLLVYLTKLLQNPLGEYQQFADYMVEQVLTQESAPRLLAASPDLQIIRGYNYKEHRNQLYSYKELSELHQRSSLYSTSGLMLSRLAEALQEAISDRQIVLISSAKANVLAKDSVLRTISRCDSEGCRKLIKTRPDLAASEHRANLLKELAALKITEELRYLLHGNKAKYDVISTQLFVVSGDTSPGSQVWEKIGRQVLEKSDESWRLINRDLANQILPDVQSSLGITELRAEAVVELIERDFEEQGADCLDTTGWSDVEYDELLWHLYSTDKQVLWKELKLHKAENNQRVSVVDSRTYLKIDLNRNSHCPKNLAALVTLIQLNPNPKIQKGQQAWIALWTPQTALYVMLSESSSYQYCSLIMETLEQAIPAWKTLPSQEVEVLEKQLRETAWLSTRSSTQGLPPNHIVKLPQNLVKYEASILALQSGHSETVLDSSIHKHKEAYQWLSQQFKVYDSLDILSLILGNV